MFITGSSFPVSSPPTMRRKNSSLARFRGRLLFSEYMLDSFLSILAVTQGRLLIGYAFLSENVKDGKKRKKDFTNKKWCGIINPRVKKKISFGKEIFVKKTALLLAFLLCCLTFCACVKDAEKKQTESTAQTVAPAKPSDGEDFSEFPGTNNMIGWDTTQN